MTYLMALLILMGAGLVFAAKYLARRHQAPKRARREQAEMVRSTEELRRELEKSGKEIVGRMEEHVRRLESLIKEADRRAESLDNQLTELHTLSQTIDKQTDELRAAEENARREQQISSGLLGELRAAAAGAAAMRGALAPAPAVERVDATDFSSVLHQSIARDEARRQGTAPDYRPSAVSLHQAAGLVAAAHAAGADATVTSYPTAGAVAPQAGGDVTGTAGTASVPPTFAGQTMTPVAPQTGTAAPAAAPQSVPSAPPQSEPAEEKQAEEEKHSAARVRALLLSGYSVEDVARETGVGRGAIELMQEMIRHQVGE